MNLKLAYPVFPTTGQTFTTTLSETMIGRTPLNLSAHLRPDFPGNEPATFHNR